MESSPLTKRLLQSTRGRLLILLQTGNQTVTQIAHQLELTNNAVRAHVASLERDGLVQRTGIKQGVRRPHVRYGLTHTAEHIFPKPYARLLSDFIGIVRKRLGPRGIRAGMRQVGRTMGRDYSAKMKGQKRPRRLTAALALLKQIGATPKIDRSNGKLVIRGDGCPLAAVTAKHPDSCLILESFLSEVIGARVKECCKHGPTPSCQFHIG
ncbi:MAG: helix-turn-helix transcriptional regulator [Chthoniobacterales bacterium]